MKAISKTAKNTKSSPAKESPVNVQKVSVALVAITRAANKCNQQAANGGTIHDKERYRLQEIREMAFYAAWTLKLISDTCVVLGNCKQCMQHENTLWAKIGKFYFPLPVATLGVARYELFDPAENALELLPLNSKISLVVYEQELQRLSDLAGVTKDSDRVVEGISVRLHDPGQACGVRIVDEDKMTPKTKAMVDLQLKQLDNRAEYYQQYRNDDVVKEEIKVQLNDLLERFPFTPAQYATIDQLEAKFRNTKA